MSEKMSIEEYKEKMEELFDECEKVLAQLKGDTLAELKESKKEGKWKLKEGERYYFRDIGGATSSYNWTNSDVDKRIFEHTLTFPTKETCEKYWHFMDTVKEKSYEFSREEWEDTSIEKYFINYDSVDEEFDVDFYSYLKFIGTVYFQTYEDAQYIIDNFKDELMEWFL